MRTDLRPLPNDCKWHIDHINRAPTADAALRRAYEYARARLRDCQIRRPEEADRFRLQLAHAIAIFTNEIHRGHLDDEYRTGVPPELPGGGWAPKPGSNVRHP